MTILPEPIQPTRVSLSRVDITCDHQIHIQRVPGTTCNDWQKWIARERYIFSIKRGIKAGGQLKSNCFCYILYIGYASSKLKFQTVFSTISQAVHLNKAIWVNARCFTGWTSIVYWGSSSNCLISTAGLLGIPQIDWLSLAQIAWRSPHEMSHF